MNLEQRIDQLTSDINKVAHYLKLDLSQPLPEMAMEDDPADFRPKFELIKQTVIHYYGITLCQFRSRCRDEFIAWPRQVAMCMCREMTGAKLQQIADFFGRNHATVIHAIDAVNKRTECYPKVLFAIERLREILKTKLNEDELPSSVEKSGHRQDGVRGGNGAGKVRRPL